MSKIAVIVLSDPKSGGEEALGRVFNALVTAYDAKQRGHDITVLFQGTGTRWSGLITDGSHPVNGLYEAVKDKIAGVSCGCADVFGSREAAKDHGFSLVSEVAVLGTSGLPSIARLLADGYQVVTF
ncbi:MAG: DsrE family protein [Burkholderiales bacterium]|nr:DsrE family protein [Burkholderiales bacterium]